MAPVDIAEILRPLVAVGDAFIESDVASILYNRYRLLFRESPHIVRYCYK